MLINRLEASYPPGYGDAGMQYGYAGDAGAQYGDAGAQYGYAAGAEKC